MIGIIAITAEAKPRFKLMVYWLKKKYCCIGMVLTTSRCSVISDMVNSF